MLKHVSNDLADQGGALEGHIYTTHGNPYIMGGDF